MSHSLCKIFTDNTQMAFHEQTAWGAPKHSRRDSWGFQHCVGCATEGRGGGGREPVTCWFRGSDPTDLDVGHHDGVCIQDLTAGTVHNSERNGQGSIFVYKLKRLYTTPTGSVPMSLANKRGTFSCRAQLTMTCRTDGVGQEEDLWGQAISPRLTVDCALRTHWLLMLGCHGVGLLVSRKLASEFGRRTDDLIRIAWHTQK